MATEKITRFYARISKLPEPANLYDGVKLPEDFELPDNILLFYHDFCAPAPNSHYRYTLVFPFARMSYYVDQKQYDLQPGQMLLLHPYQLRFLSPKSEGYQRFFITFTLQKEQSYVPQSILCAMNETSYEHLDRIITAFSGNSLPELQFALYHFLKSMSENEIMKESRQVSKEIAGAIRYINENLNRPICNQDIAGELNMSESNLRRRFAAETGQPLKSYISKQRLDLACYYLRDTLIRIDEIAALCGFSSVFAFSHFFKNNTGTAPVKYRSNCKESK